MMAIIFGMRYSAQHKSRTHAKLLKKASEQFREQGVQGTGIARLMGQVGLTHGGFYGHFENKSDLVAAALDKMFEEGSAQLKAAVESAEDKHVSAIVKAYLSEGHRDHPTQGCPVPVLTAEIARQPKSVRQAYTRSFNDRIKIMAKYMPGVNEEERCRQARFLLSGMAGAMAIARAVSDRDLSDQILAEAREFYIAAFENGSSKKV